MSLARQQDADGAQVVVKALNTVKAACDAVATVLLETETDVDRGHVVVAEGAVERVSHAVPCVEGISLN